MLLVLEADGRVLNSDLAERLTDDAYKDPAEVLRYLRKWATGTAPLIREPPHITSKR